MDPYGFGLRGDVASRGQDVVQQLEVGSLKERLCRTNRVRQVSVKRTLNLVYYCDILLVYIHVGQDL